MEFLHSTEFFVILLVGAAAVIALIAIPRHHGPAEEHLVASDLIPEQFDSVRTEPAIEVICGENGTVTLVRTGLESVTMNGTLSLKVEVRGFSIFITERLTEGNEWGLPAASAMASLDFLTTERYSLRYDSPAISMAATLSFNNTPGYHRKALLQR